VVSLAVFAALSPCRATAEPYVLGYAGAAITQDKSLRTEVEVNGAPVPVDREGRVLVVVPEARHRTPVDVVVRHVTGAVERRRIDCVEDDADVKALEVRWDDR